MSGNGSLRLTLDVILAACVLAMGCAPEAAIPAWCAGTSDAIPIHMAESVPRRLSLEEVWRVGGGEGPEVFSGPVRAAVSGTGRVAIPDVTAGAVLLVEPDGTWRGSLFRQGDGPGEVRGPVDVEWMAEDRLAVFDLVRGAVLSLSVDGSTPGSMWRLDADLYARIAAAGMLPGADLMPDGSLLLELPWGAAPEGEGTAVATVVRARSGGGVDTLQTQRVAMVSEGSFRDWPVPGAPRPLYAAGADGPVFRSGENGDYRVAALDAALSDSAVLCRAVPTVPYSEAEKGVGVSPDALAALLRNAPRPDVPARIGGLLPGEGGGLWVVRDRPDPAAPNLPVEGGAYDVFDRAGELVGTLRAPEGVYLVGEGGGQVYGFARGAFDEVILVAYRLVEEA